MYAVRKPKPQPTEEHHDTHTQAFLREVDEALHEENMLNMWRQWRYPLLIAIIALFGGVTGWQLWQEHQATQRQTAANALYSLIENPTGEMPQALQETALPGPMMLASFVQAGHALQQGDKARALALYESVIAQENLAQDFRDLATYFAAVIQSDIAPDQALEKLSQLDAAMSPLRPTALALQARLLESRGDLATALALWQKLTIIANVPPSLLEIAKNRAADLEAAAQ